MKLKLIHVAVSSRWNNRGSVRFSVIVFVLEKLFLRPALFHSARATNIGAGGEKQPNGEGIKDPQRKFVNGLRAEPAVYYCGHKNAMGESLVMRPIASISSTSRSQSQTAQSKYG